MSQGLKSRTVNKLGSVAGLFKAIYAYSIKDLFTVRSSDFFTYIGPPVRKEPEEYFLLQQNKRRKFIEDLKQYFPLSSISFCSVGCGFGGEEFLLQKDVKELVLIESDYEACEFLKQKFSNETKVFCGPMQQYHSPNKFDIIYTSGPSNWMYHSPKDGIPRSFIKFIIEHLDRKGVFIARIYGGYHPAEVISSNHFLRTITRQFGSVGLKIVSYGLSVDKSQALLVANFTALDQASCDHEFAEVHEYLMQGGKRVGSSRTDLAKKGSRLLKLLVYIPQRISIDIFKACWEIAKDVYFNLSL